ncbi:hypothetical protein, partial [Microcoleus sp. K4-C2]
MTPRQTLLNSGRSPFIFPRQNLNLKNSAKKVPYFDKMRVLQSITQFASQETSTMARMYYDTDANLDLLANKTIAIIGY